MKVLLFNGSIHENGNTATALREMEKIFREQGLETEILNIGNKQIRDCIACGACAGKGKCVFNDDVANEWIEKARSADGFVFGAPVYFANAAGRLLSIMNRMFYAGKSAFEHKVGASVAVARRAGTIQAVNEMNEYMFISNMVVPGSTYWNIAYGRTAGECAQDAEGMQTMRTLANNMAWLLNSIDIAKKTGLEYPKKEQPLKTNFI